MIIKTLVLNNFRNLKSCTLDTCAKQVVLTGENGQGKTNLLEAVYMLCYGSSFRTQNLREVINHDSGFFYTKSEFEDSQCLTRTTEVSFDGSKKTIKVDGKEIKDRKELIYSLPCISFSHEDIEFVRGEPENRRRFFDQTMTMYDVVFFDDLRRYKQVLRQRNEAVKEQRYDLLEVYDQRLATLGIPILHARNAVCNSFNAIFPDIYRAVSGEDKDIKIEYRPSWSLEDDVHSITRRLSEQRETDIKMQTTTSGPHRDRFTVTDEKGLFVNSASTGQMRLASLVFRSAQAAFYRRKTGLDPIFLIDDVLLELDKGKRARYLDYLGKYNQAFFTFLPQESYFGEHFDLSTDNTKKYFVEKGEFKLDEAR